MRPALGGMRRHVANLIEQIDRSRFDIVLFAPDRIDCAVPYEFEKLIVAPKPNPLADAKVRNELIRLSRDRGIQMLHAHGLRAAAIVSSISKEKLVPCLATLHNELPNSLLAKFYTRQSLSGLGGIIVVSEAIAKQTRSLISTLPINVIGNGVDLKDFEIPTDRNSVRKQLQVKDGEKLIVAAGRPSPEKGFLILEKAYVRPALRDKEIAVRLFDGGNDKTPYSRMSHLPYTQELIPILKSADLVVIPSLYEGQSLIAIEAMASGAAIIASNVGGLPETLGPDLIAGLVAPGDPEELAAKIGMFLNDEGMRVKLGHLGKRRVADRFQLQVKVRETENFFLEILAKATNH